MIKDGIIVAMQTPMYDNEEVNYDQLRCQVDRFVNGGLHGLFCLGTNGESFMLDKAEKIKIMETVYEQNKGRLPLYAGTGCISTRDTVELSKIAESIGFDCLSVITPYFASISQEELVEHYTKVANSVKIPILIYNIPARTGVNVTVETVEKLSHIDNIVGVKDSSGNFDNSLKYIEKTRNTKFKVFSGNDSLILSYLLSGANGGISGVANLFPRLMSSIYDLYAQGKIAEATAKQDSVRDFRNCLALGNPNSIVKLACRLKGIEVGPCRSPFGMISANVVEKVKTVLDRFYSTTE